MASDFRVRPRGGPILIALAAVAIVVVGAAPVSAAPGFKTSRPSMVTNLTAGGVTPIITVGDTIGGYMFESIPDGISIDPNGQGTVDVFVNHEASTVPFPYSLTPTASVPNQNDFTDSLVSRLKLHQESAGVMSASYVIKDSDNFHRFCSNFLATKEHGFKKSTLFTNEEGIDWVNRSGMQWPATIGDPQAREIGVVVAHDVNNGKTKPIWGMGRHNHENSLAMKTYGYPVVLSGDDSFVSSPNQSQIYSYIAPSSDAVWNDTGDLWAFVSDNPAVDDYYDFNNVNAPQTISGHFVIVPKNIATGLDTDGTDLMSTDVAGYPLPPSDGSWQRPPGATSGPGVDGPQWVLEHWSDLNNVFSFVRIEDMAYDKRPNMSNVVYIADSGRGRGPTDSIGVDHAGVAAPYKSTNGRIWKMVFDPNQPTVVTSLSILIQGDDAPTKTLTEVRQPDNVETTANGLYITEDPGSSQQFALGDAAGKNARIWQYNLSTMALTPVLEVDQSEDEQSTDVDDATAAGNMGAWEMSGIIDVSSIFGPGTFLLDVQAHTLYTHTAPGPDLANPPAGNDWQYKREGGQLVLVTIPGG